MPLLGRRMLAAGVLTTAATLASARPPMPATVPVAMEDAHAGEAAVTIDNFTFAPPVITVAAGTRVVWTNRDDIPHTVVGTGDPRSLRSPPLDTDDRFAFTFAAPGTYRYFCSLHPHMQGTVVVR
ncbi:cupredoxin family copper-binding protein [Siccirubricoccus sp. G192]|uniref:cupredoxin domain-containing protein n=1 Tax=Siccirubricoccus sp. G192 TaxID=2849651 RepID=UPI001C2BFE59|nr:cupredoxin family copper-binding protein [Siccirubricoccus sp. G192]MBV1795876.1 cupredoxin family copper-binding protein [Siccirubricoccus sp. G192]